MRRDFDSSTDSTDNTDSSKQYRETMALRQCRQIVTLRAVRQRLHVPDQTDLAQLGLRHHKYYNWCHSATCLFCSAGFRSVDRGCMAGPCTFGLILHTGVEHGRSKQSLLGLVSLREGLLVESAGVSALWCPQHHAGMYRFVDEQLLNSLV